MNQLTDFIESVARLRFQTALLLLFYPRPRATCCTVRHPVATHPLEAGYDIPTVWELLDHRDVKTTKIHTHLMNRSEKGLRSRVEALRAVLGADGYAVLHNPRGREPASVANP